MPDYTLTAADQGIYEIPLDANTAIRIDAETPSYLTLLVHAAASPVYVQHGRMVTVKARTASMAVAGTWIDVPGSGDTIAVISAANAVISICRT